MGLDQGDQQIANDQGSAAVAVRPASKEIAQRQDGAEVLGGQARWPRGRRCGRRGIAMLDPPHHDADIECAHHRIEFVARARHPRAIGHRGTRHERTQKPRTRRLAQRLETAPERVEQTNIRGIDSCLGWHHILRGVVGDGAQRGVCSGAIGGCARAR